MRRLKRLASRLLNYTADRTAERVQQRGTDSSERLMVAVGRQLANQLRFAPRAPTFAESEFRIFSQFGDDGIIQRIISCANIEPHTFVEFGVEDYTESNTRFLLLNNNWSGFVMDGSEENVASICNQPWLWRYDFECARCFVTAENVNEAIAQRQFEEVGILHIDVDGNDYWIWQAVDLAPALVIVEYQNLFGRERAIAVPYSPQFHRTAAHSSNLYFGASLKALEHLASKKGYSLIGSNSAGNNAYFLRDDLLNDDVRRVQVRDAYCESKFREGRDPENRFTYARRAERLRMISGMPVVNVVTGELEAV